MQTSVCKEFFWLKKQLSDKNVAPLQSLNHPKEKYCFCYLILGESGVGGVYYRLLLTYFFWPIVNGYPPPPFTPPPFSYIFGGKNGSLQTSDSNRTPPPPPHTVSGEL